MEEERRLKGFSKQEIFDLYKYLCIYENKIKILKNSAEIYTRYPQLKELENLLKLFTINYANNEGMQFLGEFVPKDSVYCTNAKSSKTYNFLYHLRNSIAHGQIEKDNNYIFLIDYNLTKEKNSYEIKKRFSGRGNIESSVAFNIIELINNTIVL